MDIEVGWYKKILLVWVWVEGGCTRPYPTHCHPYLRESYFWNKRDPGDLEWPSRKKRGGHEAGGAPTGAGAPPPLWAPRNSTVVLLPPIYTHISGKHPGAPRNPISTAGTFCTREIPSWGLLQRSAGGGIDHGGLLHQHRSLSDDVLVVYHRPLGP